eukprot:1160469-Pelagomonas_calceolata.AAC.4
MEAERQEFQTFNSKAQSAQVCIPDAAADYKQYPVEQPSDHLEILNGHRVLLLALAVESPFKLYRHLASASAQVTPPYHSARCGRGLYTV